MLTVNAPESRYKVCKFHENRAGIRPCSTAHNASRRYLIYSEANFEARGTDGVKFGKEEGPLLRAKFHPHRFNDKGVGPQKLKFLLRFDRNVEYKRPAGAYPLHNFHKICRICTPFQDALGVKISLDLLKGLWSYGVFNLRGLVTLKFSAPSSGETMCQTPKSFRGARTCLRFSITMPSLVGLGFHPPPGQPKTLNFLFVCLSVRHACARFRHKGVGVQKRFWCRWIGEGL